MAQEQGNPSIGEPLAVAAEECIQPVFPTPILTYQWPNSDALNADLKRLILAEAAANPGVSRSNVGGWHSDMKLLFRDEPAFKTLAERVRRVAFEMTRVMMKPANHGFKMEGWANVLRTGQYNSAHVHPGNTWSIVYYVTGNPPPTDDSLGTTEYSGKLEFSDPRPAAFASDNVENLMQQRYVLSPGPGAMIGFPSWLQHQVHPYFGPDVRISCAYNVLIS